MSVPVAVIPAAGNAPSTTVARPTSNGSFSLNMNSTNGTNSASSAPVPNGNGVAAASSTTTPAAAAASSSGAPAAGGHPHSTLVNKPTFLENPNFRFLIMDAPNDANIQSYIDVLKKKQVVVVARVCDPTYSAGPLLSNGIKVLEVPFPDGDPPPQHVVDKWLALVDQVFKHEGKNVTGKGIDLQVDGVEKPAIAIHCVAGLGRAPVLVAIALVESGMEPFDAIAFIRKKRRGAINARQLKYIENYQPKRAAKGCCTIQ